MTHPIIYRAAAAAGIEPDAIQSSERFDKRVVYARWAIMDRLREKGLSYAQIGYIVNRDHSSIIYALRRLDGIRHDERFSAVRRAIA